MSEFVSRLTVQMERGGGGGPSGLVGWGGYK